jgi:hypothetical protein
MKNPKKATVTIGGVTLEPRTAATLRRIVAKELRYRREETDAAEFMLQLLDRPDAETDAADDDANIWTDEGDRAVADGESNDRA